MTWKDAVQKVAKVEPHEMLAVAKGLIGRIAESEREDALARSLMRDAHVLGRCHVRAAELTAVKGTPSRKRAPISQISNELKKRIGPVLEGWRKELRLEWTEELLASSFALRDGTAIRWGAATVAQHKERATIFKDNAAANLDGAARHTAAIAAIEAARVGCLDELVAEREAVAV